MTDKEIWNRGRLLDISASYWQTCALHAAVKLGIFTLLDGETLSSGEVARRVQAEGRGMAMLLDALVAMGLLTKSGETYAGTAESRALLSRKSDHYLGHIILHHHHLMASWSRLPEAVLKGAPVRSRTALASGEVLESFLLGMVNIAAGLAPEIVKAVDLRGRRRLLDLGGGPGTYAIHFCQENPELAATVFDLPDTRPFAESAVSRFGLSGRIGFAAGDYTRDPVPRGFDVCWLSQILHAEGPQTCQAIVEKAVSSLEPGGLILVHEFLLDNDMAGPLFPTLFSLNMLVGTELGQAYSEAQVMGMLSRAGVREVRRIAFRGPSDSGIIAGTV